MGELTGKQRAFVEHFLGDARFNATEAAAMAGYKGDRVTLGAVGYENLRKPHIARRIEQRLKEMAMSADEILAHLAEIGRGGDGIAIDDRLEALELLGKAHGLFKERLEHSGPGGGPIEHTRRIDLAGLSDAELDQLIANLEEAVRSGAPRAAAPAGTSSGSAPVGDPAPAEPGPGAAV